MRKIICLAISFIICIFLDLKTVWLGFVPVFILLSYFKFDGNILWEIPLALMLCDVLLIAFSKDINVLVYTMAITTAVLVSIVSPKKLTWIFPVIAFSVAFKNPYTIAALWASGWYGIRTAFGYFTTKQISLQEHKL